MAHFCRGGALVYRVPTLQVDKVKFEYSTHLRSLNQVDLLISITAIDSISIESWLKRYYEPQS